MGRFWGDPEVSSRKGGKIRTRLEDNFLGAADRFSHYRSKQRSFCRETPPTSA
jgi:hypothetical protein